MLSREDPFVIKRLRAPGAYVIDHIGCVVGESSDGICTAGA